MPKPQLRADESEIHTYGANRFQGDRAVGGHLLLTDQRLAFYAHAIDRATGGRDWECTLESIRDVDIAPPGPHPLALRRRLRVDCDGVTEHFVVNKIERVVAAINSARG